MWKNKKTNKKPVIPAYPQIIPKGPLGKYQQLEDKLEPLTLGYPQNVSKSPLGKYQQLEDKLEPLTHQDILKISQKVPEGGSSNCTCTKDRGE